MITVSMSSGGIPTRCRTSMRFCWEYSNGEGSRALANHYVDAGRVRCAASADELAPS